MSRKFHHRRRAQAARRPRFRPSPVLVTGVFCAMLAVFGAGYLMQTNQTASKGFQIRTLQNEISTLKDQGERLELKLAQEQSVQAVEEKVKGMGMVPTPQVQYVNAAPPQVARR